MPRPSPDRNASPTPGVLRRRSFLGLTAGAAAAFGAPGLVRPAMARRENRRGRALNLIFCVSDGMSGGTLTLGDMLIRRRTGKPSRWIELQEREGVRRASLNTSAADSIVTDSAAASTTWGIGISVNNGSIGMTPDGRLMSPIMLRAKESGKAAGLVTTTRLTHATPAGFIACVPTSRDDEQAIAEQMLDRGVDVMLGGGAHYLTHELIAARNDLQVVRTRSGLAAADAGALPAGVRLLGLFAEQHMSYELERPDTEPSLAEMTGAALARLSRLPGGFILQVEGGRVDHAGHANDAGALVRDQVAFDEALGVAIDFASARDDTLLIATSDHGNANPGLTEYESRGNEGFERLQRCRHSFDWVGRRIRDLRGNLAADSLRAIIHEATDQTLDDDEIAILSRALRGEPVDPFIPAAKSTGPLGSLLANHFGVAFLSPNHTSDYVELLAAGPGSERVAAFLAHADVHRVMIEALDLPPARAM